MSELEDIRRKRMQELLASQQSESVQKQLQMQEAERQIKLIINKIRTPKARQRLTNIRLARPDYARQVELLLIQMAQSGRMPNKLDDEAFKTVLARLSQSKKKTTIRRG